MYRLRNWNNIGFTEKHTFTLPDVSKRLQQMTYPYFVTYVRSADLLSEMPEYIKTIHKKRTEKLSDTLDGAIVDAICNLYLIKKSLQISAGDIRTKLKEEGVEVDGISDVMIGKARESLGIEAITTNISYIRKKSIIWDSETMTRLIKKYIPLDKREKYLKLLKERREKEDRTWYY